MGIKAIWYDICNTEVLGRIYNFRHRKELVSKQELIKMCMMKIPKNSYSLLVMGLVFIFASCASGKKPTLNHQNSSYSQTAPSSRTPGEISNSNNTAAIIKQQSKNKGSRQLGKGKTHADLVREFEERMEANAERYEKEAKLAEKPQYSDFSYFGHKKKPKKRPVGKRKFCKECGIVH